jgi:hypothetical protein
MLNVMLNVIYAEGLKYAIMLSVFLVSVVMLSAVAPQSVIDSCLFRPSLIFPSLFFSTWVGSFPCLHPTGLSGSDEHSASLLDSGVKKVYSIGPGRVNRVWLSIGF